MKCPYCMGTTTKKRTKKTKRGYATFRGVHTVGTARPVHVKPWQHGGRMAKQVDN